MTLPFSFPAWVPWWVPVAILVPALIYALVFLAMPFSVFGVKSRLDILEARLDEIQGEIRALVLRLPPAEREDEYEPPPRPRRDMAARPPIPPPPGAPRGVNAAYEHPATERGNDETPRRRFGGSEQFAAADRASPVDPMNPPVRPQAGSPGSPQGGAIDRLAQAGDRSRLGNADDPGRRRPLPPPPPPPQRRAEPRIDWPR